jgi:hypothetical protein
MKLSLILVSYSVRIVVFWIIIVKCVAWQNRLRIGKARVNLMVRIDQQFGSLTLTWQTLEFCLILFVVLLWGNGTQRKAIAHWFEMLRSFLSNFRQRLVIRLVLRAPKQSRFTLFSWFFWILFRGKGIVRRRRILLKIDDNRFTCSGNCIRGCIDMWFQKLLLLFDNHF